MADRTTTSTTVMRSCTIDQDSARRPWSEPSSVASPATLTSTTLEQMLATAPRNSASMSGLPTHSMAPVPSAMVTATCAVAPTSTTRPSSNSSASRKRMPMLNISRATPMSARPSISSRLAM